MNSITPFVSKYLGNKIIPEKNWEDICENILIVILFCKFEQNKELLSYLLNTGLRKIIFLSKTDTLMGKSNKYGKNILGKALMYIREYYYRNHF